MLRPEFPGLHDTRLAASDVPLIDTQETGPNPVGVSGPVSAEYMIGETGDVGPVFRAPARRRSRPRAGPVSQM